MTILAVAFLVIAPFVGGYVLATRTDDVAAQDHIDGTLTGE
jgi:hypothetical protein